MWETGISFHTITVTATAIEDYFYFLQYYSISNSRIFHVDFKQTYGNFYYSFLFWIMLEKSPLLESFHFNFFKCRQLFSSDILTLIGQLYQSKSDNFVHSPIFALKHRHWNAFRFLVSSFHFELCEFMNHNSWKNTRKRSHVSQYTLPWMLINHSYPLG